jgi:hypothetical protein
MQTPTKILIGGIAIAAAIAAVGFIRASIISAVPVEMQQRADRDEGANRVCYEAAMRKYAIAHGLSPSEPLSDRDQLQVAEATYGQCMPGAASDQIQTLQRIAERAHTNTLKVAVPVALVCALPWLWYFLLRRIAELRDAIAGKRPP